MSSGSRESKNENKFLRDILCFSQFLSFGNLVFIFIIIFKYIYKDFSHLYFSFSYFSSLCKNKSKIRNKIKKSFLNILFRLMFVSNNNFLWICFE